MCIIKQIILSLIIKSFQQMSSTDESNGKNRTVRKGEEYCFYTKSCSISISLTCLLILYSCNNFFLSYVPTSSNLHILQSSVRFLRGKISTSSLNFRARVKQIYIQILTFRFLIPKLFCCFFKSPLTLSKILSELHWIIFAQIWPLMELNWRISEFLNVSFSRVTFGCSYWFEFIPPKAIKICQNKH